MKEWKDFLKRRDAAELQILPVQVIEYIGAMEKATLASLFREDITFLDVPIEHLRKVVKLHREWKRWQQAVSKTRTRLQFTTRLWTHSPAQVKALQRIVRMLSLGDSSPGQEAWMIGLKIWDGASKIAFQETKVSFEAKDSEHARFEHYADLIGHQDSISEIPAHRWLAARRGQKEEVITIKFELPLEKMIQQVDLYRSDLGEGIQSFESKHILKKVLLDDIDAWLSAEGDLQAQETALQVAADNYRALLETEPLDVQNLVAVNVGHPKGSMGVVWLNANNELLDSCSIDPEEDHPAELKKLLENNVPEAVVLPLRAAASKRLQAIVEAIDSDYPLQHIRAAGLSSARKKWMGKGYNHPKEIAGAIALGQRVLQPLEAWGRIDPLSLGLAEYQDLIDPERLRQVLQDELALIRYQRKKLSGRTTSRRPVLAMSRLNPMVKKIEDLRGGMTMKGIVANLTEFGAFVHIGLQQEGLVHLSELADRFVRHPSEVVQIGQEVEVRVLSVDVETRRISLSMRSPDKPRPRSKQQRKAQALQDLEDLFKK